MNVTDSRLCLTATSKLRYGERIGTGVGSLLPCLAQLSRSVSCLRVCLRNSAERAGGSNVDSRAAVPSTPFLLPRRGVATETGPARNQTTGRRRPMLPSPGTLPSARLRLGDRGQVRCVRALGGQRRDSARSVPTDSARWWLSWTLGSILAHSRWTAGPTAVGILVRRNMRRHAALRWPYRGLSAPSQTSHRRTLPVPALRKRRLPSSRPSHPSPSQSQVCSDQSSPIQQRASRRWIRLPTTGLPP